MHQVYSTPVVARGCGAGIKADKELGASKRRGSDGL
jgi:hypothetical protein